MNEPTHNLESVSLLQQDIDQFELPVIIIEHD